MGYWNRSGKTQDPHAARKSAAAELRRQAVELRKSGMTEVNIATQLSRTVAWVSATLKRELSINPVNVEELRTLHRLRLERLLLAVWGPALNGDVNSVRTATALLDAISKLMGLDAPARINVTQFVETLAEQQGLTDEQRSAAVQEAERLVQIYNDRPKRNSTQP